MLISADSHVVEPGDLWTSRLPVRLRDRAPRAVQDPDNHHWYLVDTDGVRGVDLTLSRTAGLTVAEVDATLAADPGAPVGALGGSDAVERLRDLWRDETVADVLYPTAGLSILQGEDEELQEACCRAYNDWLIELCGVDPARLLGLAMIATNEMDAAVAELERTRAAGLRGAIIWTAPPEGDSFFDPEYEPLWAAADALAMPISLHILAGRRANITSYGRDIRGTFYARVRVPPGAAPVGVRAHRRGRLRASPGPARGRGRGRHRVRREPRATDGLQLQELLAQVQRADDAPVGVLPPQRVPHVHDRPRRAEQHPVHRRRPFHVVERLPAHGRGVADVARRDRA